MVKCVLLYCMMMNTKKTKVELHTDIPDYHAKHFDLSTTLMNFEHTI